VPTAYDLEESESDQRVLFTCKCGKRFLQYRAREREISSEEEAVAEVLRGAVSRVTGFCIYCLDRWRKHEQEAGES
jgi:hypothetical protein